MGADSSPYNHVSPIPSALLGHIQMAQWDCYPDSPGKGRSSESFRTRSFIRAVAATSLQPHPTVCRGMRDSHPPWVSPGRDLGVGTMHPWPEGWPDLGPGEGLALNRVFLQARRQQNLCCTQQQCHFIYPPFILHPKSLSELAVSIHTETFSNRCCYFID